jgi:hypothetical protein
VGAIVSDIFDRVIARRVDGETEFLRTAGDYADQVLFVALGISLWLVHLDVLVDNAVVLLSAFVAQLIAAADVHISAEGKAWRLTVFATHNELAFTLMLPGWHSLSRDPRRLTESLAVDEKAPHAPRATVRFR